MINFDATATYGATVLSTTINADGSAVIRVRNTDADGNVIGDLDVTIPAVHANNVTHERTGDTGLAISQDMIDAIVAVNAQSPVLLQSIITNEKHAL